MYHFLSISHFNIKILFRDNATANQFLKILEMTWHLIPTTSEYTLLYLHLHSEFQASQRYTMTPDFKNKERKKPDVYTQTIFSISVYKMLLKIFNNLSVNKCNFQQYLLPFSSMNTEHIIS